MAFAQAVFEISSNGEELCVVIMQRNKFVDEGKSLTGQIFKLLDLLSSKKQIFQVRFLYGG